MRIALALLASGLFLIASANDPLTEILKKGAEKEKREQNVEKAKKKYNLQEVPGTKIIGVSREYYLIEGKRVYCDEFEVKCVNGKCSIVPK